MASVVQYEKRGPIAYITLNRPKKRNAINEAMLKELQDVWKDFGKDTDTRVGILTGAGSAFCAGMDISLFVAGIHPDPVYDDYLPGMEIGKPVIAAVNGHALGSGFGLALACDLRIAADTAYFGLPEGKVGHVGGIPRDLLQYMPLGIAMELLLLGEHMSAQRAYDIGLVNRITTGEELLTEATNIAQAISERSPLGVRAAKVGLYWDAQLFRRRESFLYRTLIKPQFESKDTKEGAKAFIDKRKPHFKGR